MSKLKAIYFFQYLPPWRIDVFNEMAKVYDLTIVFWNSEADGFTYNRKILLSKLDSSIETIFLTNGISAGTHSIRRGVGAIIRKHKPNIVFTHEYAPISMQCVLYKLFRLANYKLYITTSDNVKMATESAGLKAISRNIILRYADGAILYSKCVENWYRSKFPHLKTDICPNIQNPETLLSYRSSFGNIATKYQEIYDLKGANILLYTGRLNFVKGLDLLFHAFSKSKYKGWKLVLVGDGPEKSKLKTLSEELGISNNVVFAGFYSGIELYAWYDLANFFILPSRYEPFGAVVNEALVYGCPVVTSKHIGALEFVDAKNGMVFEPLDELNFVQTLNEAYLKYEMKLHERGNLMICSFKESVAAFVRIVNG